MTIDWNAILNGSIAFILLIVLRALLDLKLAQFSVKWLSWLPLRNFFREKPTQISGQWDQVWGAADSPSFESEVDRHSHPEIKQLGSYCYGEFISKGVTYVVFGRVIGDYYVGDWYDKGDPKGYFGAFQLQIHDSKNMKGRWVGHSKAVHEVKGDKWVWRKIS